MELAKPKASCQQCFYDNTSHMVLCDNPFTVSSQRARQLIEDSAIVLMYAVTLGEAVEQEIDKLFMDKEITRGLALDSAVAVATANYTKQLIDMLDEAGADKGYKAAWIMNPGTGDWPSGQMANIAQAVHAEQIGVSLLPSGMLMPRKTVTGVIGGIYMNALNMMIFPMVFCSIVMGICSIGNAKTTGKITGYSMIFFLCTTAIASAVGIIIPRLIRLGKGVHFEMATSDIQATEMTSILDTIKNLIPSNPVKAFAEGNMLQVLVFAVVVGFTLIAVGEKGQPLLNVIDSLNEVCLKVISTVMYFTPIGVFCTIVPVVEANGTKTIVSLATQLIILYVAFYGFAIVVYGGAVKLIGKTSPVKFFKAIMPAALNAFGTCSSSATIPISKRCVEKELGVSNQISSIAIPLGATVNMDAVSILMSFMIMFFANACGINVSISMMVIILLANVLLSVGTPGIPGGAIASFAALATMAGLPAGVMGVYISINTLCDMGATCVNVIGDMAGCVVLQEKIKLEEN